MGKIEVFSKWDLDTSKWKNSSSDDKFRSFAVAKYEPVINNSSRNANYVIVAYGSRVEDHSKDGLNIKNSSANMSRFIKFFSRSQLANYIIRFVMLDADAPLREEAKKLADYIDKLSSSGNTVSINVVGLSKCGALNMYIPRYFNNSRSYDLTSIYNIATPYCGTLLASPLFFYPKVKEFINSKLGNNSFADKVYEKTISYYESISSNSHQDYDIAKPWGVPSDRINKYDPTFIKDIFCNENIDALKHIKSFNNFVTGINDTVLGSAIRSADFESIGLCILNKYFYENQSDGFVETADQYLVENYMDVHSVKLFSTHNVFYSKELNHVLSAIEKNAEESNFQRKRF